MKLQLTDAEVKHLRQLLAWTRVEYMLDEDMQRGYLSGIDKALASGAGDPEKIHELMNETAEKINHVPKYVRHAIKMLTEAVRRHDGAKGDVVDASTRTVQHIEQH